MKHWEYRAGAILVLLLAVLWVTDRAARPTPLSQQGGGDVQCLCIITATPIAGSATPAPSITPTIAATPSIQPSPTATVQISPTSARGTPTPLPIQPTFSGTEYNPECTIASWAAPVKNLDYVYRDPNQSFYQQNIRSGPSTGYSISGKLPKDKPMLIKWIAGAWVALAPIPPETRECLQWLYTPLGELLPHSTD